MATIIDPATGDPAAERPRPRDPDRIFFVRVGLVLATICVAGFGVQAAFGRSSFVAPWFVHAHAVLFSSWVALYVAQMLAAGSGNLALHRRLGMLALAWIPAMAIVGPATTIMTTRAGRVPFFFDINYFWIMDTLTVTCFAGLALAGFALRRRTDWHRRLMTAAMIFLAGAPVGRLVPMPLFIGMHIGVWPPYAVLLVIVAVCMIHDLRRLGRVHPAWWAALAAMTVTQVAMDVIAYSDWGIATTRAMIAGTPGDRADLNAAWPPGMAPPG